MVCVKIVSTVVKNLYICSNNLKFLVYLVRALVKGITLDSLFEPYIQI